MVVLNNEHFIEGNATKYPQRRVLYNPSRRRLSSFIIAASVTIIISAAAVASILASVNVLLSG